MKVARLAIGAVLLAGTVLAQGSVAQIMSQPPTMQQTAVAYDEYTYDEYTYTAPEDELVAPQNEANASSGEATVSDVSETTLASGCGDPSCESCGDSYSQCEPWTLIGETCSGINVGGWLSAGIYGNEFGAANNGPLGFNDVGDGFTFNQFWFFAEKAVDTGGCGFDLGGRVDFVFGADGPDTQAFGDVGWDNAWDTSRDYGSALPQLYMEVGYNDWTVKLGHFYTIIGYEVVTAPDNFFYSHAYTQYYGEPFTHTGALASYNGFDNWTFYGGWTAGWDTGFERGGGASTFLGGASYSFCDDASITYALSAGNFGPGNGDIYMHSIVMDLALTDRLTWIIQSDLGTRTDLPGEDNFWAGVNQYLQYELNECWAAGLRIEWFQDTDGSRVIDGNTGNYYNLTLGLNYKPHSNLVFRPELRYDWFSGTALVGQLPFDNNQDTEQFSGGFDVVFTY